MTHWSDRFAETACDAGIREARQYATFADWWEGTQSGDYMLWLLEEVGYNDQRALRLLCVRFVRETELHDGRRVWDLLEDESREYLSNLSLGATPSVGPHEAENVAMWMHERDQDATSNLGEYDYGGFGRVAFVRALDWAESSVTIAAAGGGSVALTAMAIRKVAEWGSEVAEWGSSDDDAMDTVQAQHAAMIREMIPASEIEPLVNQYIAEPLRIT